MSHAKKWITFAVLWIAGSLTAAETPIVENGDITELVHGPHMQLVDPATLPKAILTQCVNDALLSKPPYPGMDVKRLALTKAITYNKLKELYYITYYHITKLTTQGGVAYVYDPSKKSITRKFWLPPQGDE